jgi:hypothetical protein
MEITPTCRQPHTRRRETDRPTNPERRAKATERACNSSCSRQASNSSRLVGSPSSSGCVQLFLYGTTRHGTARSSSSNEQRDEPRRTTCDDVGGWVGSEGVSECCDAEYAHGQARTGRTPSPRVVQKPSQLLAFSLFLAATTTAEEPQQLQRSHNNCSGATTTAEEPEQLLQRSHDNCGD